MATTILVIHQQQPQFRVLHKPKELLLELQLSVFPQREEQFLLLELRLRLLQIQVLLNLKVVRNLIIQFSYPKGNFLQFLGDYLLLKLHNEHHLPQFLRNGLCYHDFSKQKQRHYLGQKLLDNSHFVNLHYHLCLKPRSSAFHLSRKYEFHRLVNLNVLHKHRMVNIRRYCYLHCLLQLLQQQEECHQKKGLPLNLLP